MSSSNYKKEILSVDLFIENRPDLAVHNEIAIQSAINQSAGLLNSETAGLIEKVWDFHSVDPGMTPDNPLYRTDWEISQIVEAFITQTQYILNMGNDLTQGSSSFSIGNINSSFSRPEKRDIIAPGVHKLLQNARVFNMQSIDIFGDNETCDTAEIKCLTKEVADRNYVAISQPNAVAGNVAVISTSNLVTFANPNDLSFSNFNATRIKQWNNNNYVTIDKVNDLAFFGANLYGFKSAMSRGEIYLAIAQGLQIWNKDYVYGLNTVVKFYDEKQNVIIEYLSLVGENKGNYPPNTPEKWKEVGRVDINIQQIVDLCNQYVIDYFTPLFNEFKIEIAQQINDLIELWNKTFADYKVELENVVIPPLVEKEVTTQINALPTIENIIFAKGTTSTFKDKATFDIVVADLNILPTQYKIVDSGNIIGTGENGLIVGDNLIKQSDLPNVDIPLKTYNNSQAVEDIKRSSQMTGNTGYVPNGGAGTLYPQYRLAIQLNGGVTQTEFKPQYKEMLFVEWLENITQTGAIKQGGVDLTNYYNKTETNALLDNKLDVSTYQENETIQNKNVDMLISNVTELCDVNSENILNLDKKVDANLVEAKEYTDAQIVKSKLYTTISTGFEASDLTVASLGELKTNGEYLSMSYRNAYNDLPLSGDGAGMLKVISFDKSGTGSPVIQQWYSRDNPQNFYMRKFNNGKWFQWFKYSGV